MDSQPAPLDESLWPLTIGTRVRYIGRPKGERAIGTGGHWLCGGAEGEVTSVIPGYPRHRCPDHDGGIECVCQDDSGWVEADEPSPVVHYVCACGRDFVSRCISSEDEGVMWERA